MIDLSEAFPPNPTIDALIKYNKKINKYQDKDLTLDYLCSLVLQEDICKIKEDVLYETINTLLPKEYVVYTLYLSGELIYVGSSYTINSRIQQHTKDKSFDNVKVCIKNTKSEMLQLEHKLISEYKPRLNKDCNLSLASQYLSDINDEVFIEYEKYVQELKVGFDVTKEVRKTFRDDYFKYPTSTVKSKKKARQYRVIISDVIIPTFKENVSDVSATEVKYDSNSYPIRSYIKDAKLKKYLKDDTPTQGLCTFFDKYIFSYKKWRYKGSNKWYCYYSNKSLAEKMISDVNRVLNKSKSKTYDKTDIFPFGKYKGRTVKSVVDTDRKYILWCIDTLNPDLIESLSLKDYL